MNREYVHFLYCLSKWIEFVNIFLIVCLYIWWWSRYCVRGVGKYRAKFCCFFKIHNLCFDLLLSLSFICIKSFPFCLYYSYSNLGVFRAMVYAAVIGFIFNSMCRFRRKQNRNVLYLINIQIYLHRYLWRLRLHHSIAKAWRFLQCCS